MTLRLKLRDAIGRKHLYKRIYVIRSNRIVQYVGKAEIQSVATRLAIHIVRSTHEDNRSNIAELFVKSFPQFLKWTVEIFTLADASRMLAEE